MSLVQIQPGGLAVPSATRVATDGTSILGDGSSESPLRGVTAAALWEPGAGSHSIVQIDDTSDSASANTATGANSLVVGEGNAASGIASYVEGAQNVETIATTIATGATNHIEGNRNTVNVAKIDGGGSNHVEGTRHTLTGTGGCDCQSNHVEGDHNTLNALGNVGDGVSFNHIEGVNHILATVPGTGACSFNHVEGSAIHLNSNAGGDIEFSHFEGAGHVVTSNAWDVDDTHVEGYHHVVTDADTSHIEGDTNTVSTSRGTCNHVEGHLNAVTGQVSYMHVEGSQHAVGDGAHTISWAHVEGHQNTLTAAANAAADTAHVEGAHCLATAATTHTQGDSAASIRETQSSRASGKFAAAGDAQTAVLILRGSTPGLAPAEAVVLLFGAARDQALVLEDGKGYLVKVTGRAYGGGNVCTWTQNLAVKRAGGVTTIAEAGLQTVLGDGAVKAWTLAASVGVGPDRLVLTFTTVGTTTAAHCAADVELFEVTTG